MFVLNQDLYTRQGFVYVLSNKSLVVEKGIPLLKIGASRKHPIQRTQELSASTGVPGQFQIEYYRDFRDCFRAETLIHRQFNQSRANQSREFFRIPLLNVVTAINDLANKEPRLSSSDVTGGAHINSQHKLDQSDEVPTPWALLFETFEERPGGRLNKEERERVKEYAWFIKMIKNYNESLENRDKIAKLPTHGDGMVYWG